MSRRLLSPVARSNYFTMSACAQFDWRQKIPGSPTIPPLEVRMLRAKLIMEEALETVEALGIEVHILPDSVDTGVIRKGGVIFSQGQEPNLQEIIDGNCDEIYVCVGTLLACGVHDTPHLEEVCKANDKKFPGGKPAGFNQSGKYTKPVGWTPPNHKLMLDVYGGFSIQSSYQNEVEEE